MSLGKTLYAYFLLSQSSLPIVVAQPETEPPKRVLGIGVVRPVVPKVGSADLLRPVKEIWYRPYLAHTLIILLPTPLYSGGMQSKFLFASYAFVAITLPDFHMASQRQKFSLLSTTITVSYSCGVAEAQTFCNCVFSLAEKAAKL